MPDHKFKIGQTVFVVPSIVLNIPGGVYVITKHLPERNGEFLIPNKERRRATERVVRESQLATSP